MTTWIDKKPPEQRRSVQFVVRNYERIHYGLVATIIVILGLMVFALTRIRWDAPGMPSLDSSTLPWVGWLLVIPAWVGGAMNRGRAHAKGIRHSHFHAIHGKTLAAAMLVIAVLLIAGGG